MAFVPLNALPLPAHMQPAPRPRPVVTLHNAPVVSELVSEGGAFVLRALDESLLPESARAPEASRWQKEMKTVRVRPEDEIEEVVEDGEETGEWVPSGSELPEGEPAVQVLESLATRAGLLVVVFFRSITDPSSLAYLSALSARLLPHIRKKGGRIIGITSAPLPSSEAAMQDIKLNSSGGPIDFPLLRDPTCTLAKRYRVYVNKEGRSHEGVVILQVPVADEDVVTGGGSAGAAAAVEAGASLAPAAAASAKPQTLYHWHAAPGPQTDEEADRGDAPEILWQQRVPEPWMLAVRYGLGSGAFRQVKPKVSLRAQAEAARLRQAKEAANRSQTRQSNARAASHLRANDPDGDDERWGDEEEDEQRFLASTPHPEVIWKLLVAIWAIRAKEKHLAKHTAQLCRSAVKRLARDWREVTRFPLPSIQAHPPYDNNILEWHANLTGPSGPYAGVKYHLQLDFPRDYPLSPPIVRFRGRIHHANVFGSYICLDMLTDVASEDGSASLWQGWSSAYTVQSILLQLQAFLFDGARQPRPIRADVKELPIGNLPWAKNEAAKAWNKTITDSIAATRAFKCQCRFVDREANQFVKDIQDKPVSSTAIPMEDEPAVVDDPRVVQSDLPPMPESASASASKSTPPPKVQEQKVQEEKKQEAPKPAAVAVQPKPQPQQQPQQQPQRQVAPQPQEPVVDEWVVIKKGKAVKPQQQSHSHNGRGAPRTTPLAVLNSKAKAPVAAAAAPVAQRPASAAASSGPMTLAAKMAAPPAPVPVKKVVASQVVPVPAAASSSSSSSSAAPAAAAPVAAVAEPVAPPPMRPLSELRPVPLTSVLTSFDPWDPQADPDVLYRSSFFGRVVRLTSFGAFVEFGLPRNQWGMAHVSQLRDDFTENPAEVVAVGDLVKCRITRVEPELGRIGVSLKGRFGKLVAPIPSSEYPARIVAFTPEGGMTVEFHDGAVMHRGLVRNDSFLTRAFTGLHFWSSNEVARVGQMITVKLADIEMQPVRTFVLQVVDASQVVAAAATAAAAAAASGKGAPKVELKAAPVDPLSEARPDSSALCCFHSKASFRHELLGFPLNLEFYNSGEVSNVHAQLDLLGRTAFEKDGVRRGVSRAPFTHWMPLFIDAQHAGDMKAHEQAIADVCFKGKASEKAVFHPLMVLKVLPALLNTMIVAMMKGNVHESVAALNGYVSIFQLLVAFALRYPSIQESANVRLRAFMDSESGRSKKECPNLGELLSFLTVTSEFAWLDVAKVLLTEVMDRNVKWALQAYPELKLKVKEEDLEENAKKAEAKAGMKGLPAGLDAKEAAKIKERRRITLVYQKTGKTPAQQAAEAAAAAAEAAAAKAAAAAAAAAEAAAAAAAKAAAASSSSSSAAAASPDADDGVDVGADLADECEYPDEGNVLGGDIDAEEAAAEAAEAEAAAVAAEEEEKPTTRAEEKRFALLASMDRGRLPKSFKAGRVSYRLVLFHVHFLEQFRGLSRAALVPLPTLHRRLQHTLGCASAAVQLSWQAEVKGLKRISTWRSFFSHIRLSVPSDEYMLGWLRHAVDNSLRRRYHSNRPPPLTPAQLAKREAIAKKRELEARMAEDGDYGGDSGHVEAGDFSTKGGIKSFSASY